VDFFLTNRFSGYLLLGLLPLSKKPFMARNSYLDFAAAVLGFGSNKGLARSYHTLTEFASELRVPSNVLIEKFEEAGVRGLGPADRITEGDKLRLLEALRAWHSGERIASRIIYERKVVAPEQRILVEAVNDELLRHLAKCPQLMYQLTSRRFEELVARIFSDHGFDVELTRASRDGGYDILAKLHNPATSFIALVECKKYSPENRVGVEIVRGLYGVTEMKGANQGLVVTSSFFTRGAVEETARIGSKLGLKDYDALTMWLQAYGQHGTKSA
jgi:hypothetical protein